MILQAHFARFVSLTDPPDTLKVEAVACDNLGCCPVLVGPAGQNDTVLAAGTPDVGLDGDEHDPRFVLNMVARTAAEISTRHAADARVRDVPRRAEWPGKAPLRRLRGAPPRMP